MPKPIKKRIIKPKTDAKEEVRGIVARARELLARYSRHIAIVAGAVALVVALSAGSYYYRTSADRKADGLRYDGYRQYFGLYEAARVPRLERLNKALESFKDAYEIKSDPVSLYYVSSSYYALGRYDEALSSLNELVEKFPADERLVPLSYYKMAMAYMKTGREADALKALDRLYGLGTSSYKDLALFESARLLEGMGRGEDAKMKYETLARDFPASAFAEEAAEKALKNAVGVDEKGAGGGAEAGRPLPGKGRNPS